MSEPGSRPARRWEGMGLALALSLAFMAGCLWWVLRELEIVLPAHRVTSSLSFSKSLGSPLPWQVGAFGAALLLCHVALAFVAFGLARLTQAAFPGGGVASRGWLVTGWLVLLAGLVMAANTTWHPASIFAGEESWWRSDYFGHKPVTLAAAGLAVLVALLALRAAPRAWPRIPRKAGALALAAVVAIALVWALPHLARTSAASTPAGKPHILVGRASWKFRVAGRFGGVTGTSRVYAR